MGARQECHAPIRIELVHPLAVLALALRAVGNRLGDGRVRIIVARRPHCSAPMSVVDVTVRHIIHILCDSLLAVSLVAPDPTAVRADVIAADPLIRGHGATGAEVVVTHPFG